MTENQKLREALQRIQYKAVSLADAQVIALEALATTEPESTGMPELHAIAHIELGDESHDVVTLEAAKAYGERLRRAILEGRLQQV